MSAPTHATYLQTCLGVVPLNTGGGQYGVFEHQVLAFAHQLNVFLSFHHKALVVAMTVTQRFDGAPQDNRRFSDWLKRTRRRIKRQMGLKRIVYGWFRERAQSTRPHYHLVIAVDGSRYRSHYSLARRMNGRAVEDLDFSIGYSAGRVVMRSSQQSICDAMYWISYFCKARSKSLDSGTRSCGFSQLAPKLDKKQEIYRRLDG